MIATSVKLKGKKHRQQAKKCQRTTVVDMPEIMPPAPLAVQASKGTNLPAKAKVRACILFAITIFFHMYFRQVNATQYIIFTKKLCPTKMANLENLETNIMNAIMVTRRSLQSQR